MQGFEVRVLTTGEKREQAVKSPRVVHVQLTGQMILESRPKRQSQLPNYAALSFPCPYSRERLEVGQAANLNMNTLSNSI